MGVLQLTVDPAAVVPGALVPVEISDVESGSGAELVVVAAGRRRAMKVQLTDGRHVVRAIAPDGQRWSDVIDLAGRCSVRLLRGLVADQPLPLSSRRRIALSQWAWRRRAPHDAPVWLGTGTSRTRDPAAFVLLLALGRPMTERIDLGPSTQILNGRPPRANRSPVFCAVAGRDGLPVFTAVPPGASAEVHAVSPGRDAPSETRIRLGEPAAQTLLDHLAGGRFLSASLVAAPVLAKAVAQRGRRRADPVVACVAGYYALKVEAPALGADWSAAVARQFPWLTDALVIHAVAQLRAAGADELPEVRRLLLQATEPKLGPPRFTQGLLLLHDAVLRVLGHQAALAVIDPAMTAACERVERFVRAADWSRNFTTYPGMLPQWPQAPSGSPFTESRSLRRLGEAGRLPVLLAQEGEPAESDDHDVQELRVRHTTSGLLVHAAADDGVSHARRVVVGAVTFDVTETQDRSDGGSKWLLTARSARVDHGWAVVFVRGSTDPDAPYAQYVIPLIRSRQTRDALGSLVMGPSTEALDWYAAETVVHHVESVAGDVVLQRSLARAAFPAVASALRDALANRRSS